MQPQWQISPIFDISPEFLSTLERYCTESSGKFLAQLLHQRGLHEARELPAFLHRAEYTPTSPFAFGQEMQWALQRIQTARKKGEKVTIWGDFDADGVTSTSVLWEGLGQFLTQYLQLDYYIPNRFTESHGLNIPGLQKLANAGTRLIITCDTGSTNLAELEYAQTLGIDIIITDHHSLPSERPPVVAIINPRYFEESHPLYHLSGVAVAYKLVEALYETFPTIPQQPLTHLLDLVAIGLIADLVALKGDCRYLAQCGIEQLQSQQTNPTRPGVAMLLKMCQKNGDRPTDISFGLGPRINAVSRIHGDAQYVVELLTSRDVKRCQQLAEETELANTRRKEIQNSVVESVKKRLSQIDLSTTPVIVLEDPQWSVGVLGLVAGQIAQEYYRPTILLSTEGSTPEKPYAMGSARSIEQIDLYQLLKSQAHLMHRFGGHPFAAGLSLRIENLPIFIESIQQEFRQRFPNAESLTPKLQADLVVTVADLGKSLFREFKLLEPCGMGNPVPKLLIQNCWFENLWNKNTQDYKGKTVKYIKTHFDLWDSSVDKGFPGVWWGHYQDEIPKNQRCDVLVELDFNPVKKRYEMRLLAVRPVSVSAIPAQMTMGEEWILDWRGQEKKREAKNADCTLLETCPVSWNEVSLSYREAIANFQKLALAYSAPFEVEPRESWQQFQGIAKYLFRTQKSVSLAQIAQKLGMSEKSVQLGLLALEEAGFFVQREGSSIMIQDFSPPLCPVTSAQRIFLDAIAEEQFKQRYFYQVPVQTLQSQVSTLS